MPVRIAIPQPTSFDLEYNRLNAPAYADAVRAAGGEPVLLDLHAGLAELRVQAASCAGFLLPGSPADVSPASYGQEREEDTASADVLREELDRALLEHAFHAQVPVLGVCFGAQMLNVYRGGTLVQDLAVMPTNHAAARGVAVAHMVRVAQGTLMASLVDQAEAFASGDSILLPINSSHHQAVAIAGTGLSVSGRSSSDGVVEALELAGTDGADESSADDGAATAKKRHFVLGVQWHPERTTAGSGTSRALFARLVAEAAAR